MARVENPDSILHPQTRQGKLPGGHKRALPGMGVGKVSGSRQVNLNPDASEEELRKYLGVNGPRLSGYSRDYR